MIHASILSFNDKDELGVVCAEEDEKFLVLIDSEVNPPNTDPIMREGANFLE